MIDTPELLKSLKTVVACSSKKETLPAFGCFAFTSGRVVCSSGKIVCCAEAEIGFEGLVETEGLLLWLKALPKAHAELTIDRSKASQLVIEAGKASLEMSCHPISEFPEYAIPQTTDDGVHIDKAQSLEALRVCKGCIGGDFKAPNSGLFVEWDGKGTVYFRSTDNTGAVEIALQAKGSDDTPPCKVCVPAEAVDHLIRTGGVSEILFGNGNLEELVWFRTTILVGSRTRSAPEANRLVKIFEKCGTGDMVEVTDELCEAFDTVAPVAALNPLGQMEAVIWNGEIQFHATSTTVVGVRAAAPIKHAPLDVEKRLAFSAPALSNLLDYADSVHFPDNPLGHIQAKSESLRGVMALIRL